LKKSCFLAVATAVAFAAPVLAFPPPIDSARINPRIFNDFGSSTFSSVNNYPAHINLTDGNTDGHPAFANLHNWRLSADGGASSAEFANGEAFSISADVTISTTGTGGGEGGLTVSPWFSQDVDGVFNMRTTDGEIAVFGGRLPFYSFTGNHGITYLAGTTVHVSIEYDPQAVSAAMPGLIRYTYINPAAVLFTSGWIPFDEGNPSEDPPYGVWGVLNEATVGGRLLMFGQQTSQGSTISADFDNVTFIPAPGSVAVLALGGLLVARRRR